MNGKQPKYLLSPSLVITQAPKTIAQYPYYLYWANSLNRNSLDSHFEENHPISAYQWGFTPGKSMTGALLDADHWHQVLKQVHNICTVFFDCSKAFDSVPHHPLWCKLQHHAWCTHAVIEMAC